MSDHAHTPSIDDLLAHGDFLRALARRLVTDEATANDLVQEVWLRALQRPPTSDHSLAGWCARVVRNLVRDRVSSERARDERERARASDVATATSEPAEPIGDRAAAIEQLGRAFAALPASYRDVLYLRYYEDLGPRAIAEQLGCSVPTVKTRLRRGLELLRQDLQQRVGEERNFALCLLPLAIVHARAETASLAGGVLSVARVAAWGGALLLIGAAVWVGTGSTRAKTEVALTVPQDARQLVQLVEPGRKAPPRELDGQTVPPTREPVAVARVESSALRGRIVYASTGGGVPFYGFDVHGLGDDDGRSESIVTQRNGGFGGRVAFGSEVRVVFPGAVPAQPPAQTVADARAPRGASGPSDDEPVVARISTALTQSAGEPDVDERRVERDGAEEVFEVALGPTYFVDLTAPEGYRAGDFEAAIVGWKHESLHRRKARTRIVDGERPWVRFAPPDEEVYTEPWTWHLEVVSRDGEWAGRARVDWVRGVRETPVTVTLAPQTSLTGVVRDNAGEPLSRVGVRLQEPGGERTHYRATDAEGRYRFELLDAGSYVLYLREAHYRPWKDRLVLGGGANERDVTLNARPPGGAIQGSITSRTGTFQGLTFLFLEGRDDQDAWARRTVQWEERNGELVGEFEFPDVGHGTYRLACNTVEGVPIARRIRTLTPPATDLSFVIEDGQPALTLDFHVVAAATGAPLESFWVLTRVEGGYIDAERVRAGTPMRRSFRAGTEIEWWVFDDGFRPRSGRIHATAPDRSSQPIDVRLEPGFGALFIAIAIESYRHVPDVTVLADGVAVGTTDETGNLVLDLPRVPETLGVDPDRWWIYSDGAHRSHIDPKTGTYDVGDRAHVAAYLRPVE